MATELTDSFYLNSIFYNIYDIDSVGVRPQMALVQTLVSGERIGYEPPKIPFSLPDVLYCDKLSNLFANPVMAIIFDPSAHKDLARFFPADYFGKEAGEKLQEMKAKMERLSLAGRHAALKVVAGYNNGFELLEPYEIEEVSNMLNSRDASMGRRFTREQCERFLEGAQLPGFENELYEHWNTAGRQERTSYHAAKLDLMNAITDAAIRKAHSVGLDPDAFTRNDPQHAKYWMEVFKEDVPTPEVLLARSREIVGAARRKYSG